MSVTVSPSLAPSASATLREPDEKGSDSSGTYEGHPLLPEPPTVVSDDGAPIPEDHPLFPSQERDAHACTESLTVPTTWRLLLAALGAPVDFFVSNAEPELQAELASAGAAASVEIEGDGDRDTAEWKRAMNVMVALRDARALKQGSTTEARRVHAEKELVKTLLELQSDRLSHRLLLSSLRGEAGESILHLAALFKLYDVALLLVDMEPMLMAGSYLGTKYKGENIVHMLCAGGELVQLRRLAQRALFPRDEIVDVGAGAAFGAAAAAAGSRAAPQRPSLIAQNRARSWRLLWRWEAMQAASDKTAAQQRAPLTPDWCRAWLRATWATLVNAVCTGSFFSPPPEGTCYYGGTPLSFAAVLGHVPVVRFLVVEAGCTRPDLWAEVAKHEAGSSSTLAVQVELQIRQAAASHAAHARSAHGLLTHGASIGELNGELVRMVSVAESAVAPPTALSASRAGRGPAPAAGYALSAAAAAAAKHLAELEARAAEERLTFFPGGLGSVELLQCWDPSVCARIDVQDASGNTAGHLAVIHFSSAHMFEFLAALYRKGYGRCDTAELHSEPHAQFARAVLALAPMRLRGAEVAQFSPDPAHPDLQLDDAGVSDDVANSSAASIPYAPVAAAGAAAAAESAVVPQSPAGVAPPAVLPHPPLLPEATAAVGGSMHSVRTNASVVSASSGESPRKLVRTQRPLIRLESCYIGAQSVDKFYSLRRVVIGRPEVFSTGPGSNAAFLPSKQARHCAAVDAETLARQYEAAAKSFVESLSSASAAASVKAAASPHSARAPTPSRSASVVDGISTAWHDLEVTVAQKIEILPGADNKIEARQAAAGIAFIQSFAADLKRSVPFRPQLIALLNKEGLTPFTLAARRGKRAIVEHLWRNHSSLAWKWGSVTARTFELNQVDDIGQIADTHPGIVASLIADPDSASSSSRAPSGSSTAARAKKVDDDVGDDNLKSSGRRGMCCASAVPDEHGAHVHQCCGLRRGRSMRSAAWICGPRHVYRLSPALATAGVSTSSSFLLALWRVWCAVILPLRFALSLAPEPVAHGMVLAEGSRPSQRTVLQEVIRGGHWHMLEPSEGEQPNTTNAEVARSAALTASISVQGVVNHGRGGSLHDHRETAIDLYHKYRARAMEISSHGPDDENDDDDVDAASGALYSGSKGKQEDSGRQLLQLVQRKWQRLYAVHFFRAAIYRTVTVLFAWSVVILRAGLAASAGPDNLSCVSGAGFPGAIVTCQDTRTLVYILTIGALLTFAWHAVRWLTLGSTGRRLLSTLFGGCSKQPGEHHLRRFWTHTSAAYVAGHSGSWGLFYVVTLLLASALLGTAGIIDLTIGWIASSSVLYALGGFFAGLHLLYFLLGFGRTGPLMVMLGVALPTFGRWLCLFVPNLFVFAYMLFVLSQPSDGNPNGFQQFFTNYVLFSFDNSMQPQPTGNSNSNPDSGGGGFVSSKAPAGPASQVLFVIFIVILILVSNIALLAILIAVMTHAFEAHLSAPRSRWHIERARIIMQLESTMSAWDRLSVPLNHRYFIWAAQATPLTRSNLLTPPPISWLGAVYPEELVEGGGGGGGGAAQAGGSGAGPVPEGGHTAIDVGSGRSAAAATAHARRPMFYCQEEGSASAASLQGRRAKAMIDDRFAAPNRATLRLRDIRSAALMSQGGDTGGSALPLAAPLVARESSSTTTTWGRGSKCWKNRTRCRRCRRQRNPLRADSGTNLLVKLRQGMDPTDPGAKAPTYAQPPGSYPPQYPQQYSQQQQYPPPQYPPQGYPQQQQQQQPYYPQQQPQSPYGQQPYYPPQGQPVYAQQPVMQMVPMGGPTVVVLGEQNVYFGDSPVRCNCPNCHRGIETMVSRQPGSMVWLLCLVLFVVGAWPFCLIPFCVPSCFDVTHTCPSCGIVIRRRQGM